MENELKKLQQTQLEMLKLLDQICREHNITYSLYAGTLLGAVRHRGFIPWDDDLDVCMSRENYNRFIALWPKVKHDGYILQNKQNSPHFSQSFTKIRKEHSAFLQDVDEIGLYHTGIFIDIFPIDRIPSGFINRGRFYWHCMLYQLLTREFAPTRNGRIIKIVSNMILFFIPAKRRNKLRGRLLKLITAHNNDSTLDTVAIETIGTMRQTFSSDLLDSYHSIEFENSEFMCFSSWDEYLRKKYGNYMQLPPEEERVWKHHPIIVDFEQDVKELGRHECTCK